jgi:L-threonylcarbamoyladenylate synthase
MLISPNTSGFDSAVSSIKNGELVAFPTDTYFALGADGLNTAAVESVFLAKGRNPGTPVPILISDLEMAESLVTNIPDALLQLTEAFWPGALTIVVPASDTVPEAVTAGTGTVGLRIPAHELARDFIRLCGTPLTGTSCNLTGRDPIKDANVVEQVFGEQIAGCIDSPCGVATDPSTVVSYRDDQINVLRLGAIDLDSLRKTLGDIIVS